MGIVVSTPEANKIEEARRLESERYSMAERILNRRMVEAGRRIAKFLDSAFENGPVELINITNAESHALNRYEQSVGLSNLVLIIQEGWHYGQVPEYVPSTYRGVELRFPQLNEEYRPENVMWEKIGIGNPFDLKTT